MAVVESTGSPLLPKMLNLISAVGPGCPNQADDVKFVQFALRDIFISTQWQAFLRNQPLTGIADDRTVAWIWLFQSLIKSMGSPVTADKRVDRANGMRGPMQHQVYTIFHLNHQLSQAKPVQFADLVDAPEGTRLLL